MLTTFATRRRPPEKSGFARHATFILDQKGVIRAKLFQLSYQERPAVDALINALKEARNADRRNQIMKRHAQKVIGALAILVAAAFAPSANADLFSVTDVNPDPNIFECDLTASRKGRHDRRRHRPCLDL